MKIKSSCFLFMFLFCSLQKIFSQDMKLFADIIKDENSTIETYFLERGLMFPIKLGVYKYQIDKALSTIGSIVNVKQTYKGRIYVEYVNTFKNVGWDYIEIIYIGVGTEAKVEQVSFFFDKFKAQEGLIETFNLFTQKGYAFKSDCSFEGSFNGPKGETENFTLNCRDYYDVEAKQIFKILTEYPYSFGRAFGKISISFGLR